MRPLRCVLATLVACAAAGAAEPETNLLENPGFEEGDASPRRWVFNTRKTDSKIAWDDSRGRAGARSARITNPTRTESGNVVQSIRLDPPLEPGSLVEFSAMASIEIDLPALGLAGESLEVEDLLSRERPTVSVSSQSGVVPLSIEAEHVRVLRLSHE